MPVSPKTLPHCPDLVLPSASRHPLPRTDFHFPDLIWPTLLRPNPINRNRSPEPDLHRQPRSRAESFYQDLTGPELSCSDVT
jgi:hypothetical protein